MDITYCLLNIDGTFRTKVISAFDGWYQGLDLPIWANQFKVADLSISKYYRHHRKSIVAHLGVGRSEAPDPKPCLKCQLL